MNKIYLAVFLLFSSAGFYSFTTSNASPLSLPGCKNGCFTNVTYNAYNFTLPINKWVEYCSLTPVPGVGASCSQATSEAAYGQCLTTFCPFLAPYIAQKGNYECLTCLTNPVVGESRTSRIFRCSANYIDTDASQCAFPRPQNVTALADNAATFQSRVSDGVPATVQWQASTDNGQSFVNAPGGIAATYSFSAVPGMNGTQYRAMWNVPLGSIPTLPGTLAVLSQPPPATRIFVSNAGGQGMVEQHDASNGVFSNNLAPVYAPKGIIGDPADGSLLVASATENQILRINGQTGAPLGIFVDGAAPCGGSTLNGPSGIAFGPNRYLYVADKNNNRVVAYDGQTGTCVGNYASGSSLNQPNGLVFGPEGYLYVANMGGGTVARFAPGGGTVADTVNVGTAPAGITISPLNDNLYVTDQVAAGQVYAITRSTFQSSTPTVFVASPAGGLVNPEGLTFGPGGNLYVASFGSNQVLRFNGSTGALLSTFIDNVPAGLGPTFLTFASSIAASASSATFSPNSQQLTFSASVLNAGRPATTGTVVFSVFNGNTQIGSSTSPAAVSNGNASGNFTLPGGTAAGTYSIRAVYSESGSFSSASDTTKLLTVNQATPVITWNPPAANSFGSALSGSQLNATANVPGTFIYTPPAGTVLPVGNGQSLFVQLNPTNSQNYKAVTASVPINITAAAGPATLISTSTLARESGTNNVIVTLRIANTGGSPATVEKVNSAKIGTIAAITALPASVANIPAGGASTVTLTFPPSVGIAGSRPVLAIGGTYSGGSFGQSARVLLP